MYELVIVIAGVIVSGFAVVAINALYRLTEKIATIWRTERKYETERDVAIVGIALKMLLFCGVSIVIAGVFSLNI